MRRHGGWDQPTSRSFLFPAAADGSLDGRLASALREKRHAPAGGDPPVAGCAQPIQACSRPLDASPVGVPGEGSPLRALRRSRRSSEANVERRPSGDDRVAVTDVARAEGLSVGLVLQPYRVAGRRSSPPPSQLDAAWIAVVDHLRGGALRGQDLGPTRMASACGAIATRLGRRRGVAVGAPEADGSAAYGAAR